MLPKFRFSRKTPAGITLNDYQASYKYYMVEFGKNDSSHPMLYFIAVHCVTPRCPRVQQSWVEWWRREPNLDFIGAHYKCEGKKCVVVMFSYYYGGGRS